MHDLVIRNGLVVDGSAGEPFHADVAIDGATISAVGSDLGAARREIDAQGRIVTPGWVDMHTHYDAQATWDPELTPSGWHGVTTVIMGNCGVGFAPAAPDRREWLIGLMEGVEDIPGAALTAGIQWEWETFGEYLDALDRRRYVMDIGTQVPHGALRAYVMGERGAANEPATAEDCAEMRRLAADALRAGALGISTSRTPLHRSVDGVLVPGTHAEMDEVFALGDALVDAGHGGFQGAYEHPALLGEMGWLRQLAEHTGHPVTVNLQQDDQAPEVWRDILAELDRAAADDVPLYAQVHGRPVGILMSWGATVHPFSFANAWGPLAFLSPADRLARLAEPDVRAALTSGPVAEELLGDFTRFITTSWHKMFCFTGETDYEPGPESSVAAIAQATGREPADVAYDHLLSSGGNGVLYFPLFNYSDGDLGPTYAMHQHPRTRMGLADGGAHVGSICDGSTPSFMVAFWTRDRMRGPKLPLAHIVKRQSRDTALHYGLADRGLLAPGYRADVNVIDYERLAIDAPRLAYDLPGGAKRFVQGSTGYDATICAGEVVREHDEFTGAHPGRLLRGPTPEPVG
ncbi:MAG TPA: amidohydrolase family protein [Acidimicrobiales bacterium]|nr:amidohydrolase family protein [Acidimicrobiales bacterium]